MVYWTKTAGPKPWSIGRAASHGCLRMMNKDIEELYALVDVGTPVFIY